MNINATPVNGPPQTYEEAYTVMNIAIGNAECRKRLMNLALEHPEQFEQFQAIKGELLEDWKNHEGNDRLSRAVQKKAKKLMEMAGML